LAQRDANNLQLEWQTLKLVEQEAARKRREVEDQLCELLEIKETDELSKDIGLLRVTKKHRTTVNPNELQRAAKRAGLIDKLGQVTRVKVELDARGWRALTEEQRAALAPGLEVKPQRAGFTIKQPTKEEQ